MAIGRTNLHSPSWGLNRVWCSFVLFHVLRCFCSVLTKSLESDADSDLKTTVCQLLEPLWVLLNISQR